MPEDEPTTESSTRTLRFWLGRLLREVREGADVSIRDIAVLVDGRQPGKPIDTSSLSKFENDKQWPRQLDQTVAAYAHLCGYEDARDLWAEALTRWRVRGGAPAVEDLRHPAQALRLATEADRRTRPYAAESRDKPISTRRRRATP